MTHTPPPIRPARAAIAAVLALTATPLLAQDMVPGIAPATAPTLPQALPAPSAAPTMSLPGTTPQVSTSQAPTVQAQPPAASLPGMSMASPVAPPVVTDMPVAAIAPSAEVEASPAPRATPAPRTTTARSQPARRQAAPLAETGAPTGSASAPVDTPMIEQDIAVPLMPNGGALVDTPVTEQTATNDPSPSNAPEGGGEVWGWMAALLAALGLGGGAIALRRTRTRDALRPGAERPVTAPVPDRQLAGPHDRPVMTPAPRAIAPATASFVQPSLEQSVAGMAPERPIARPITARPVSADSGIDHRRLEALIAQRPSRDNPFRTRPNRKRRALFLMRNGYGLQSAA
jgi:hypothetical protein